MHNNNNQKCDNLGKNQPIMKQQQQQLAYQKHQKLSQNPVRQQKQSVVKACQQKQQQSQAYQLPTQKIMLQKVQQYQHKVKGQVEQVVQNITVHHNDNHQACYQLIHQYAWGGMCLKQMVRSCVAKLSQSDEKQQHQLLINTDNNKSNSNSYDYAPRLLTIAHNSQIPIRLLYLPTIQLINNNTSKPICPTPIKYLTLCQPTSCLIIGEDDVMSVYDYAHFQGKQGKITMNKRKDPNRNITAVYATGDNVIFVGYSDGLLSKYISCLDLKSYEDIKGLHSGQITAIYIHQKYVYTSGTDHQLKKVAMAKFKVKQTKQCSPLTCIAKLDVVQLKHIVFGVDMDYRNIIMFDQQLQLQTSIFTVSDVSHRIQCLSVFQTNNTLLVGISKVCPQVYQLDPVRNNLTKRIALNTLNYHEISLQIFPSQPQLLALVIGTGRIYYYSTQTWKLLHRHQSSTKSIGNKSVKKKKYQLIIVSSGGNVVVTGNQRSLQVYGVEGTVLMKDGINFNEDLF